MPPEDAAATILTERLALVPATLETLTAELGGSRDLATVLGVEVPPSWPPELYDRAAIDYVLVRLTDAVAPSTWWTHYFVRRSTSAAPAWLIGVGGYKGPPANGVVEIGYAVLPEHQRLGYATEAARALVTRAFREPAVSKVVAHTLPHLTASIGVLTRCDFHQVPGTTEEEGAIRFERARPV